MVELAVTRGLSPLDQCGRVGSNPTPSTNTKKINFNNDGSVAQLDRATPF